MKEFGAFVEFLPGKDGLVHISELANFRVKQTEDIVKMGDDLGQMPRRGRKRPRETLAQSRDGRTRKRNRPGFVASASLSGTRRPKRSFCDRSATIFDLLCSINPVR